MASFTRTPGGAGAERDAIPRVASPPGDPQRTCAGPLASEHRLRELGVDVRAGARVLEIDPVSLIDRAEELRERPDGFRAPEQEVSTRVQRVVEGRDDAPLEGRRQVDQQIATADQIDSREGGIRGDILANTQNPESLVMRYLPFCFEKKRRRRWRRHLRLDVPGYSPSRLAGRDRVVVDRGV